MTIQHHNQPHDGICIRYGKLLIVISGKVALSGTIMAVAFAFIGRAFAWW